MPSSKTFNFDSYNTAYRPIHMSLFFEDKGVLNSLNTVQGVVGNIGNTRFGFEKIVNDKIKQFYTENQNGGRNTWSGNAWAGLSTKWKAFKAAKGYSPKLLEMGKPSRLRSVIFKNARNLPTGNNIFPNFDEAPYVWWHEWGGETLPKRDFIRAAMRKAAKMEAAVIDAANNMYTRNIYKGKGSIIEDMHKRSGMNDMSGVYNPLAYRKRATAAVVNDFTRNLELVLIPRNALSPWFWLFGLAPPSGIYMYAGAFFNMWNVIDGTLLSAKSMFYYARAIAISKTGKSPKLFRRQLRRRLY